MEMVVVVVARQRDSCGMEWNDSVVGKGKEVVMVEMMVLVVMVEGEEELWL